MSDAEIRALERANRDDPSLPTAVAYLGAVRRSGNATPDQEIALQLLERIGADLDLKRLNRAAEAGYFPAWIAYILSNGQKPEGGHNYWWHPHHIRANLNLLDPDSAVSFVHECLNRNAYARGIDPWLLERERTIVSKVRLLARKNNRLSTRAMNRLSTFMGFAMESDDRAELQWQKNRYCLYLLGLPLND